MMDAYDLFGKPSTSYMLFMLEFCQELWSIHGTFAWFAQRDGPFWSLEEVTIDYQAGVLDLLLSRTVSVRFFQAGPWTDPSLVPWRPGCHPTVCLVPFSEDCEPHHLMVTATKATLDLPIPKQFFLLNGHRRASPLISSLIPCQEAVINILLKTPGVFVHCCVALQQILESGPLWGAGPLIMRLLPLVHWRGPHLLHSQTVCSSHPPQCCPHRSVC